MVVRPKYVSLRPTSAGWPAQLEARAFNRLDQYANSPGRTYCYAELAVSFLAVVETIASTHCVYPRRDGQAELAWVVGYIPARRRSPILVLTGLNVD